MENQAKSTIAFETNLLSLWKIQNFHKIRPKGENKAPINKNSSHTVGKPHKSVILWGCRRIYGDSGVKVIVVPGEAIFKQYEVHGQLVYIQEIPITVRAICHFTI